MINGTAVNVDVTAPGAIIALALMFLKVTSYHLSATNARVILNTSSMEFY